MAWFEPLNPYGFDDSILKLEKVNFSASNASTRDRLFCWAISSKRYALFNVDEQGRPIIRKASAHGLGHLLPPYGEDDAPTCFPEPLKAVLSGKEKLQRWHYDVWCAILEAVLAGRPGSVRWDFHPGLKLPTISRYTATSPDLLRWFDRWNAGKGYPETVKPFGFLHTLHPSRRPRHPDDIADPLALTRPRSEVHPVAPYDLKRARAAAQAFCRVSGEAVPADQLETYAEAMALYPFSPEPKFLNAEAFDTGVSERRHVRATGTEFIGKEADRWEEDYFLGLRTGASLIEYGGDPSEGSWAYAALRSAITAHGASAVSGATGVSRATLAKLKRGERATTTAPHARLRLGLRHLDRDGAHRKTVEANALRSLREVVEREGGIRKAAASLGTDASSLSKRLKTRE